MPILPALFGLVLFQPLSLPECARLPQSPAGLVLYEEAPTRECLETPQPVQGGRFNFGRVDLPVAMMPAVVSFPNISVYTLDGKLAEIGAATLDYNHAGFIVAQLTAKFGSPSSDEQATEDLSSIAVPSRVVTWRGPGFRLTYRSVNQSVERGLILMQTDQAIAERNRLKAADDGQRLKL